MSTSIPDIVARIPFVDTHEHYVPESVRLNGGEPDGTPWAFGADDWTIFFAMYLRDDAFVSGMGDADLNRFFAPGLDAAGKFRLFAPYWQRIRHTGYAQAVRRTLRALYDEDDLTAETAPRLAEKYEAFRRPGFYREILGRANVEYAQVNSLRRIFEEPEQPDLLRQDLGLLELTAASEVDIAQVERETGRKTTSFDDWLATIEWYFATYGPRAVAVKSQMAYRRRLDYAPVDRHRAEAAFRRRLSGWRADEDDMLVQNFLFRHCIEKATAMGLPVKLHTGFYAGRGYMRLERLRHNAADVALLLQAFPDTTFVLMHIGYPYQNEFLALAKHYRNAVIDMCWAWIIDPLAATRFVKDFICTAPSNKLLTFGGDYLAAETTVGHAQIARQGIAQAMRELVAEGWIGAEDVPPLAEAIMRGNAHQLFGERGGA